MPAVARLGDFCTGHGSFPPRPSDEGSPDVFINSIAALRLGDHWSVHCKPGGPCHDSTQATGSNSVFVNGRPLARVGDVVACGSLIANGSPNVYAGDLGNYDYIAIDGGIVTWLD